MPAVSEGVITIVCLTIITSSNLVPLAIKEGSMLNKELLNRIKDSLQKGEPITQLMYRQLFIDLLESVEDEGNVLPIDVERFRLWISLEYDDHEQELREKDNAFDYGVVWATFAILEQSIRDWLFDQLEKNPVS